MKLFDFLVPRHHSMMIIDRIPPPLYKLPWIYVMDTMNMSYSTTHTLHIIVRMDILLISSNG